MACTFSVQLPVLRRLRRWQFYKNTNKIDGVKNYLPISMTNNLIYQLHVSDYNVFRQGKKNYAYTGLLGRFGPIVVHASIILLLVGSTLGSFSGYMAQEIVPRGELFHNQNLIKFGSLSTVPQNISWRVNDFWITYTNEFKTNQFYSDLSLLDNTGNELKRKTIFVNEPFVYRGLTLYQTDWDVVGIKFMDSVNKRVQLPLKKIIKGGQKFWFGSITVNSPTFSVPQTFTILINDLRGNIYIYNSKGSLLQECSLGQPIYLMGNEQLVFLDFITSTGLQIKTDPGIQIVYTAFLLLMVSTYISFISYSQIWATQTNDVLDLVGNSNRAVLFFQAEFRKILNTVRSAPSGTTE
jgi:cytochrome c biogenesis protein